MTDNVADGWALNQPVTHAPSRSLFMVCQPAKIVETWRLGSFFSLHPLQHYPSYCSGIPVRGARMSVGPDPTQLLDQQGRRKYLCGEEMVRFLSAARQADQPTRAFCLLLVQTGCRISEALAITPQHLDRDMKRVIFRTLKRRRNVFRAVPVPDALMKELLRHADGLAEEARLWPWARQTAWRKVKTLMEAARIDGAMAMPKGLRHAYGIRAAGQNVPPNLIQRWLGHADPATTAIYIDAVGSEERAFARRLW